MARNPYTSAIRTLKQAAESINRYKPEQQIQDFEAMTPKDKFAHYRAMLVLILDNRELLKSEGMKSKDDIIKINFIDLAGDNDLIQEAKALQK